MLGYLDCKNLTDHWITARIWHLKSLCCYLVLLYIFLQFQKMSAKLLHKRRQASLEESSPKSTFLGISYMVRKVDFQILAQAMEGLYRLNSAIENNPEATKGDETI